MEHQDLAHASAVLGAVGAPVLLLGRSRLPLLLGLALLLAGELGLAYALVPDAPSLVVDSAPRLGALIVAAALVAGLAVLFVRIPAAAPVALLIAAPFRISVALGSQQAFLLVPFFVVL